MAVKTGKISDFYDLKKFEKDTKTVLDGLAKVAEAMAKANTGGSSKGASDPVSRKKQYDEQAKATEEAARLTAKLNQLETENARTVAALKEKIAAKNRERKLEAQLNESVAGAYKALNAQLEINRTKLKDLAAAGKQASDEYKKLAVQVTEADKKIKEIDASVGQHQRNVGNYTSALDNLKGRWAMLVGAWTAGIAAMAGVISFMKESIQASMEQERADKRLLAAVNNNAEAFGRLSRFKEGLMESTLFTEDEIQAAITMGLELGKTEEQTRKLVETAMGLSKVNGQDLNTAMINLSATYDGQTGKLGKLADEVKGLTDEQYANGAAVDILNKKYGSLAHEGLNTAEGQVIQMRKQYEELQESIGDFAREGVVKLVNAFRFINAVQSGGISSGEKYKGTMDAIFKRYQENMDKINANIASNQAQMKLNLSADKPKEWGTDKQQDAIQKLDATISDLTTTLNNQIAAGDKEAQATVRKIELLKQLKEQYTGLITAYQEGLKYQQAASEFGTGGATAGSGTKVTNQGGANIQKPIEGEVESPQFKLPTQDLDKQTAAEKEAESFKKEMQVWADRLSMVQGYVARIQGIINSMYDARLNQIDSERSKVTERYDKEYEDAEGNARKQREIRKRQSKEEAELDKQARKIKRDQAILNKSMGTANAIINTAVGATSMLANPGGTLGIILAVLAIALGAVEIATILSTPIPAARHGIKNAPGGIMRVSEEGTEGMMHNGKMYLTPEHESLMYVPKGADIIPHNEMMQIAGDASHTGFPKWQRLSTSDMLRAELALHNKELIHTIRNKKELHLNIDKHGFRVAAHQGATWEHYVNDRISL